MRQIAAFLFLFFVALPVFASPFSDLPQDHWASNAVQILSQKGIVEGYPGGLFMGNRALTRYEAALMVARLLANLQREKPEITPEDLTTLRALVEEYKDELSGMGIRLSQVEHELAGLTQRVNALDKVKILLHGDSIGAYQWIAEKGSNFVQAYDFTTGRPIAGGGAAHNFNDSFFLTGLLDLSISTKMSDNWVGGGVIGFYSGIGSDAPGDPRTYWGVTPPYLDNWWTGFSGKNGGNLESIWTRYEPANMEAIYGSYYPVIQNGFVFKGEPNPTYYGPDYLPLWGYASRGNMQAIGMAWISYESDNAQLANQSPYLTKAALNEVNLDLDHTKISLDNVLANNDVNSVPVALPVVTPLNNPFHLQTPSGNFVSYAGAQEESLWGAKIKEEFTRTFNIEGEYGISRYSPDTTGNLVKDEKQTGHLWSVTLGGKIAQNGSYSVGYMSVDPDYDPFILGYPGLAVIRNFAIWNNLPNFYFMHDTLNYPQNREGFKGSFEWSFGKAGTLSLYASRLVQKDPTAALGADFPVYIESVFITSPNAGLTSPLPFLSNNKGVIQEEGGGFTSRLTDRLSASLSAGTVHLTRAEDPSILNNVEAPNFQNNWDETYTIAALSLNYALTSWLIAQGGVADVRLLGTQNGFPGYNIGQTSWFVGLAHNVTSQAALALQYRQFNTKEATPDYGSLYPGSNQGPFFGDSVSKMIVGRLLYNF